MKEDFIPSEGHDIGPNPFGISGPTFEKLIAGCTLFVLFEQLKPHDWKLWTCDEEYACLILEAPEKGGDMLSIGTGPTIEAAITGALAKLQKKVES